jgi:hypothetical protein
MVRGPVEDVFGMVEGTLAVVDGPAGVTRCLNKLTCGKGRKNTAKMSAATTTTLIRRLRTDAVGIRWPSGCRLREELCRISSGSVLTPRAAPRCATEEIRSRTSSSAMSDVLLGVSQ